MSKQQSMFPEIVEKYFRKVVTKVTEKYNGEKQKPVLLYKTMLTEEYSADLSWEAAELNNVILAADVVSMDASIPLKKRGSIGTASGKLAKVALKFRKGEKEITDLNIMASRGTKENEIAAKTLNDVPRCIGGIEYRNEMLFEEALSTGSMCVEYGEDNDGVGIRVTFVPEKNEVNALVADWVKHPNIATPREDVQQLFDLADDNQSVVGLAMISKKYFEAFRKSRSGKELVANFERRDFTDKTVLPTPGKTVFLQALEDEYGVEFRIVDNTFKVQLPSGKEKSVRPWVDANIVLLPQEVIGRFVYGTLAEETNPVDGVKYEKSGSAILISKYSHNEPALEELTAGQELALPVLDGANSIYILHANVVNEGAISVAEENASLSFSNAKSTKAIEVDYRGAEANLTAFADDDFVTVTLKGNKLTIACAANSADKAPARNTVITVTDGVNECQISVTQAANE